MISLEKGEVMDNNSKSNEMQTPAFIESEVVACAAVPALQTALALVPTVAGCWFAAPAI